MFEVGAEYLMIYGTTEDQTHATIKVLEISGTWLKVESDTLDSLINTAAPMFISARKRDRKAESAFSDLHAKMREMNDDELRRIANAQPEA